MRPCRGSSRGSLYRQPGVSQRIIAGPGSARSCVRGANSSGRRPRIGSEFQAWLAGFLGWQRGSDAMWWRLRTLASRFRGLIAGRGADAELDTEIEEHLRSLAERFVSRGMSPEAAEYA